MSVNRISKSTFICGIVKCLCEVMHFSFLITKTIIAQL